MFVGETVAGSGEILAFETVHAVRMMLDIVPNPFVGREIVGRLLDALRDRGFDDRKLGGIARLVVEEMRKELDRERDTRAEALFKDAVADGRIQFRLRLDGRNWRMPFQIDTTEPPDGRQLVSGNGGPLEKSLFAPVYESEFNRDEGEVAVYLDGEEALTWWHRNVARAQYGIQAGRRARSIPISSSPCGWMGLPIASPPSRPRGITSTISTPPTSETCFPSCPAASRGTTAPPPESSSWSRTMARPFSARSSS